MKTLTTISLLLLIGPLMYPQHQGYNQIPADEYLITTAGDTLFGKVRRNLWTHKNEVSLRMGKVKTRYHYKDVKEFRSKKMTLVILPEQSARTDKIFYLELLVTVDGKARLLVDGQYNFHFEHYVGLDEHYIPVTPSNLVHHIWPAFMRCLSFGEAHRDITMEEISQLDKVIPKLKAAITYYNAYCL